MDRREAYYAAPSQIAQISDHCGPSKTNQRSDVHRNMRILTYIYTIDRYPSQVTQVQ